MPTRHDGSIDSYNGSFLNCRGVHHPWAFDGHYDIALGAGGRVVEYRRTLTCPQCSAERVDYYDAQMRPSRASTRRYPDGYPAPRGERIQPAAARLEQVRRQTVQHRGLRVVG